ncbi:MAG: hypothetical protein L0H93_06365, partial [Nocardioides sp.]|nr:hypothetical protein [Nocardioides sp.]
NQGRSETTDETTSGDSSSTPAAELSVIEPDGVTDFDPEGDGGEEYPELAPLAIDGDPGTAWQTSNYKQNFGPGGLKDGVGLIVTLAKPTDVRNVEVSTIGNPTSMSLYAGTGEPPTTVDGLEPVATGTAENGSVSLQLEEAVSADWVLVWLTSLPSDGGYRGQVAEIVVRG